MKRYAMLLDSGTIICPRMFRTKDEAQRWKQNHNRIAREQKRSRELVSLRYVIGLISYKSSEPRASSASSSTRKGGGKRKPTGRQSAGTRG